jgi:hypothetical protein
MTRHSEIAANGFSIGKLSVLALPMILSTERKITMKNYIPKLPILNLNAPI